MLVQLGERGFAKRVPKLRVLGLFVGRVLALKVFRVCK